MEYGIEIELSENQIYVLIAESPFFFSKLIETLYKRKTGWRWKDSSV